ncbi:MAG: transcription termination factor Rho, partial [Acidobacteria bacterium]|nr:transcription termination factor Rho [Acidobacteriota bacterium]
MNEPENPKNNAPNDANREPSDQKGTSGEGHQPQGEGSRPKRRRRRPRRRRKGPGSGGGGGGGPLIPVEGFLWIRDQGQPLLVDANSGFEPSRNAPIAPNDVIQRYRLESGVQIEGQAKSGGDRPRLAEITAIEGMPPEEYREKAIPFPELVSIDPLERYRLETDPEKLEMRVSELIAPLGKGQRCLIVSPPKAGKTTLLQQMAHAIAVNHPEAEIFVLLVDERPEEVTEWRRSIVRGQVFASSSDQSMESHVRLSEMVMERARRLVEMGRDIVIFMDSLTRMSRAYNNMQRGSGRILSGGIDARTMERPRRHFGAARNVEHGGSLTMVATCLIDTGSRMDEVIFQEFKGTGNM